jgi:hypothetical protein
MKFINKILQLFFMITICISCNIKSSPSKKPNDKSINFPDTTSNQEPIIVVDSLQTNPIHSFTYDNRNFRILKYTQSKNIIIQYQQNNVWHNNMEVDVYDQFKTSYDINQDGFNDIYSQTQGYNYINFYLPNEKIFTAQYKMMGDGEELIDTTRKLYANYREPYHMCNYYISQLFDYTNTVPNYYYTIVGETSCKIDHINIVKLYKVYATNDSLVLLDSFKPKNSAALDYATYWKQHYKKLMNYR